MTGIEGGNGIPLQVYRDLEAGRPPKSVARRNHVPLSEAYDARTEIVVGRRLGGDTYAAIAGDLAIRPERVYDLCWEAGSLDGPRSRPNGRPRAEAPRNGAAFDGDREAEAALLLRRMGVPSAAQRLEVPKEQLYALRRHLFLEAQRDGVPVGEIARTYRTSAATVSKAMVGARAPPMRLGRPRKTGFLESLEFLDDE